MCHLYRNNNGFNPIKDNLLQNTVVKYIQFFNYTDTNNFWENIKLYSLNAYNLRRKNKILGKERRYMRNIFNGLKVTLLIKLLNILKDTNSRHLGFDSRDEKVEKILIII